ncbi:hypothetical protein EON77_09325, partial [bacterium]
MRRDTVEGRSPRSSAACAKLPRSSTRATSRRSAGLLATSIHPRLHEWAVHSTSAPIRYPHGSFVLPCISEVRRQRLSCRRCRRIVGITNMRIGIIGAGPLGSSLARKLHDQGHTVKLANSRGPDSLASLAVEVGATAASVFDAVKDVDVVIVSIPMKGFAALPPGLFHDVAEDLVIVDTANYYPVRDGLIEALERGMVESRWVSTQLGRPVVKAFN